MTLVERFKAGLENSGAFIDMGGGPPYYEIDADLAEEALKALQSRRWRTLETFPAEYKEKGRDCLLRAVNNDVYIGYYDEDAASCGYPPWRDRSGNLISAIAWAPFPEEDVP